MSAHGESDAEDEKIASLAADETKPRDDDEAEYRKAKAQVILDACQRRDLDALRDLAISEGGFLSDSLRQRTCESTSPRRAARHGPWAYCFACGQLTRYSRASSSRRPGLRKRP